MQWLCTMLFKCFVCQYPTKQYMRIHLWHATKTRAFKMILIRMKDISLWNLSFTMNDLLERNALGSYHSPPVQRFAAPGGTEFKYELDTYSS